MSAPARTAGGRIDRGKPLRFTFDGRKMSGFAGDTLASALLANGVHLVGRSFKYHRPRGILSAGVEEPNALVTVRRDRARYTPNLCATTVELYEGLTAESQNRWPSLNFDVGAAASLIAPFIPAGFYYKTFMWPRGAWRTLYEPYIRAAAGLGRAPSLPDPDRYSQRYAHCDVLVVGAGAAGIAAALAAARGGARVILCDEQPEPGGFLLTEAAAVQGEQIEQLPARQWLERQLAALAEQPRLRLLTRTTAFGCYPHNLAGLCERLTDHLGAPSSGQPRERLWQVRAREIVFATGAIERPLVFPGNDRPGVMLCAAARTFLNRYGVVAGKRIAIVTACEDAYRAALDLRAAGAEIAVIADTRATANGALPQAARAAGLPLRTGVTIIGTRGRLRVSAIEVAPVDVDGVVGGKSQLYACDLVLMSAGFTPNVSLFSQARGKLAWDDGLGAFVPGSSIERVRPAGACRGLFSLDSAARDGQQAGEQAAGDARQSDTHSVRTFAAAATDTARAGHVGALPQPAGPKRGKAFVDWQNDVTTFDLQLATREGFRSVEHVKRYTTTGMATDQGKTSNLNALGVVAGLLKEPLPQVGLTTFRPPYTPVTFGTLAGFARGELLDPMRTTAIHDWAAAHGAVFEDVGLWKRARYFPHPGEDMHAAVARECRAVRQACGLFDASTLGKIAVAGPDAAVFLERMYVNNWSNLAVGRCRYGILLRDDGFIYDDGVVARLAADRFHVTTTTGGAARVLSLMEDYLQTEWPQLQVWLTSTTEQWAVIAVQGPNSRRVLESLVEGIDLDPVALPHMGVAQGQICGVPSMLMRVSFTGELGYEVNVPADFAVAVWEAIAQAGRAHGITPYGTEAMHVLRAEKGFIIIGQDTDGTVTPDDAGLSWAISKTKPDFLGRGALRRAAMSDPQRRQLVGLLTQDPTIMLPEGAQVMAASGLLPPTRPLGFVSSAYLSPTLGRSIALALVAGGRARLGETLYVRLDAGEVAVQVSSTIFHDPKGERLNV
jgi:sarcosine oxidase, subunit alpha